MKLLKKWMLVTGVVCGGASASVSHAQDFNPYSAPFTGNGLAGLISNQTGITQAAIGKTFSGSNKHENPRPAANPAFLRFTPNLATRQRNLAGFIAKTRAQSPENADQMEQLFGSTDIFAAFAQGLAPAGLKIDNVADCYTTYWISAWEAANSITGSQTSRTQAQAVKAQVSRALLSAPEFTKASAAQKQEFAEALLIQAALISASAEAAAGDPAQMEAVGTAVRQGAKVMGLDLDAMELSETGFKPVS